MDNQDMGSFVPQASSSSVPHSAGWVAFEYIIMFLSLSFMATGVAGLLHHLVDNKITAEAADAGASFYSLSYYSDYLIPFYLASAIVGFPVFVFLALRLKSMISSYPETRRAKIRKAAIYVALIWTFLAMMIRLERTVYEFIKGDAIVANTLSHLAVTLLISGAIFIYFAREVKQDDKIV